MSRSYCVVARHGTHALTLTPATMPPNFGTWRRVAADRITQPAMEGIQGRRSDDLDTTTPAGPSRNPNYLPVRDRVVVPASALDIVALHMEAAYLKQHVVIARFVVELAPTVRHALWIRELEDRICARVALHRDKGSGFYFI